MVQIKKKYTYNDIAIYIVLMALNYYICPFSLSLLSPMDFMDQYKSIRFYIKLQKDNAQCKTVKGDISPSLHPYLSIFLPFILARSRTLRTIFARDHRNDGECA